VTSGGLKKLKRFQLHGASPPWPPDQGLCPWTPLGALSQTPVISSRSRARHARGSSPPKRDTLFSVVTCCDDDDDVTVLECSTSSAVLSYAVRSVYWSSNIRFACWSRYVDAWSRSVRASVCQPFVTAVDFPLKLVQYSGADLRALRSTNQRRHVVNDAVAKTVRHLGLLCTTRRRGSGRRSRRNGRLSVGWRRPHALLTVADDWWVMSTTDIWWRRWQCQAVSGHYCAYWPDWQSAVSQLIRVITSYTNYYFWSSLP